MQGWGTGVADMVGFREQGEVDTAFDYMENNKQFYVNPRSDAATAYFNDIMLMILQFQLRQVARWRG